MEYVLLGLVLLAVPLFLPLALWVALYRTRTRLTLLEQSLDEQKDAIARLDGAGDPAEGRAPAVRRACSRDRAASPWRSSGAARFRSLRRRRARVRSDSRRPS